MPKMVLALLQLTGFVKARRGPSDRRSKIYPSIERKKVLRQSLGVAPAFHNLLSAANLPQPHLF